MFIIFVNYTISALHDTVLYRLHLYVQNYIILKHSTHSIISKSIPRAQVRDSDSVFALKSALVQRLRRQKRAGFRTPSIGDCSQIRLTFDFEHQMCGSGGADGEDSDAEGAGALESGSKSQQTKPPSSSPLLLLLNEAEATLGAAGVRDGCVLCVAPRTLRLLVASSSCAFDVCTVLCF